MRLLSVLLLLSSLAAGQAVELRLVDPLDLPCDFEQLKPPPSEEVALAVGEYESAALLARAAEALEGQALRVKGLPRGVEVEARVAAPFRRKLGGNREATQPYMLEPASTVSMKPGEQAVHWLTFHAGAGA